MYAFIEGSIEQKHFPHVVVMAGGVGYLIEVSLFCFEELPAIGERTRLQTVLQVREDAHQLFGFSSTDEQQMFRAITRISGFGAKLAMSMLSNMRPHELVKHVRDSDKAALIRLPGIGAKSADRLLIEMRDRLPELSQEAEGSAEHAHSGQAMQDAQDALMHLGYKSAEISRVLGGVAPSQDASQLIRKALQLLARNKKA